jgi:hypothetical protein
MPKQPPAWLHDHVLRYFADEIAGGPAALPPAVAPEAPAAPAN